MKKKLTCSLLALSLAFNTTAVPEITKVFAQDEVIDEVIDEGVDEVVGEVVDEVIDEIVDEVVNNLTENDEVDEELSDEEETLVLGEIETEEQIYFTEDDIKAQMEAEYQAYMQKLEKKPTTYGNSFTLVVENGKLSYTVSDGEATITGFTINTGATTATVIIPSEIDCLVDGAIEKVTVTTIGDYAFSENKQITNITLPDSVTSIGEVAFNECSKLTSIDIPNSVTSIGRSAFSHCTNLANLTIGNNVDTIGSMAFYYCTSLTSVTIPSSLTSIDTGIFSYCTNLESLTIQNGVTSIGNSAFSGCYKLESVNIPNSVTSIGESAFCFCYNLTSVDIPNSVTSIGRFAFGSCTSLKNVNIPNSVTSIGISAFHTCTSLKSVTIPKSVIIIRDYAFNTCSSLSTIYYSGDSTDWKKIYIGSYNEPLTNLVGTENFYYNSTGPDTGETTPDDDAPDEEVPEEDIEIGDVDGGEFDLTNGGHAVYVVDKYNNKLSGITVTIGGNTYTTENGIVNLTKAQLGSATTVSVSNSEYKDQTSVSLGSSGITYVVLQYNDEAIEIDYIGYKLLDSSYYTPLSVPGNMVTPFYASGSSFSPNDYMLIDVILPEGVENVDYSYVLLNGSKVVQTSSDGSFRLDVNRSKINVVTDIYTIAGLGVGDDFSVRITDKTTGTQRTIPLKMTVDESETVEASDWPLTFELGDKIFFGVSESVPIFGGLGAEYGYSDFAEFLNIGLPEKLPFSVQYVNDSNSTTRGFTIGRKASEIFGDDYSSTVGVALEEINKKISSLEEYTNVAYPTTFGKNATYSILPVNVGANVTAIGKIVNDKNNDTWSGNIVANADADADGTFKTVIPVLGYPLQVEFKLGVGVVISGTGDVTWDIGEDTFTPSLDITIAPGIDLTGKAGAGYKDILSAYVYGKANVTHTLNLLNHNALTTLLGEIGIEYSVLGYDGELPVIQPENPFVLYEKTNRSVYASLINNSTNNSSSELTLINRDYLNKRATYSSGDSVIKSNVYSNSMPEIINVNGTSYIFWIDDAGDQRSTANKAALYYSYHNGTNWTSPNQVVSGSTTNDFSFDLAVDSNNKIHVTWLKSNTVLADNVDVDTMLNDLDIYYTTISNDTIEEPTRVTENTNHDNMVSISDDGSTIAWIEYPTTATLTSILSVGVGGTIKYASTSNLSNVTTLKSNVDVTSLGVVGSQVVYSVDGDVYIGSNLVYSGNLSSNIQTYNGVAYWLDSHYDEETGTSYNTLYSSSGSSASKVFTGDINTSYSITSDGPVWLDFDVDANYYLKGNIDTENSYVIETIDTNVSQPRLTNISAYLDGSNYKVVYYDNDQANLEYISAQKQVTDISLDFIGLDSGFDNPDRIISASESVIAIDITNNGNTTVTTANLTIAGSVVESYTGFSIAPGESTRLYHNFNHGSLSSAKNFSASITTTSDKFSENNSGSFTLGYSKLNLSTDLIRINSSDFAQVTVSNEMYTSSGATLKVYSHSSDGQTVFTKTINDISNDTDNISLINLSAIEKEQGERIDVFYLELIPTSEDISDSNRIIDVISISSGRETLATTTDPNPDPDPDPTPNDDDYYDDSNSNSNSNSSTNNSYTSNSLFGTSNNITKVTTPNTVTLNSATAGKTDAQVLSDAEVSYPYSAKAVLGSFSLSGNSNDAKNNGITVTMDSDCGYTDFAVLHYDDAGNYKVTYSVFNGSPFTFYPNSFSSFYVVGLYNSSSTSTGSGSSSSNLTSNYYEKGSISIPTFGYIPEFRNVLIGELINLDKISINDMDILGWYYDPEFTRPVENTSMFVVTQEVLDNGLYPKFKTVVSDTLIDGSVNAGYVDTSTDTNTSYTPSAVPSTIKKILSKLF